MGLRALLLIFIFAFTSGLACAIVCPEDTLESHESDCTQCTSTDLVVSAKPSDEHGALPHAFSTASIDPANLLELHDALDNSKISGSPPPSSTPIRTLRI